jgi:hypothetical protein
MTYKNDITPPGQEEWLRHKEESREATSAAQTGWWFKFENPSNWTNHPVRSINGCFAVFLDVAATPPGQEG